MVRLVPMTQGEFEAYLARDIARYAEANVTAGYWTDAEALEKSRQAHEKLLPDGLATRHHYLFTIQEPEHGQEVGTLWLAIDRQAATPTGFIYDLFVDEPFRRQGYATQAMRALEDKARELGLEVLYLHVFAFNRPACELYDKLGYEATSLTMRKRLTPGPPRNARM